MRVSKVLASGPILLSLVVLVGATIRLAHLAVVDLSLPFRYGGFFLESAQGIVAQNYLLPTDIPFYTQGGVPFAYPPLGLYALAFAIDILSLPPFLAVTLLPPIVAVLTVPSFWLLTNVAGLRGKARLAALLAYAMMPNAYLEQIEGAGLVESFGTLALIWLAIALIRAYKNTNIRTHVVAGLTLALSFMASPGSAYASAWMVFIFVVALLLRGWPLRSAKAMVLFSSMAAVAFVVSSVYWFPVLSNHGVGIFLRSFTAQHETLGEQFYRTLEHLAVFRVADGPKMFWWDVAIGGSILWALVSRRLALVAWFIALYVIPREGGWMASIPAAILVGHGLSDLFGAAMAGVVGRHWPQLKPSLVLASVGGVFLILTLSADVIIGLRVVTERDDPLSHRDVSAMRWVRDNTPRSAEFVVLAGEGRLTGEVLEWAPQIMSRTVVNTPYGSEWQPAEALYIDALNRDLGACRDVDCVISVLAKAKLNGELYLYVGGKRGRLISMSPKENRAFGRTLETLANVDNILIIRLSARETG